MDSSEFRKRGREVIEFFIDYIKTISQRNIMHDEKQGYLQEKIPKSAPEQPENFDEIMNDIKSCVLPGLVQWRHPGYFAYFPSGGSYPSILANMLSSAVNCVGFSWAAGPACAELEVITLDWLGKMLGLPESFLSSASDNQGGGVIQVSAADATLASMIAARFNKVKELGQQNPSTDKRTYLPLLTAYCSTMCHSSIEKVMELTMVKLRVLEVDDFRRLRGKTLNKAVKMDKEKGFIPFFVFASLGTNACCSCDDIKEIGQICKDDDIWLHVDGAYGGNALICPEFQHFLEGIEFVDSFSIEPSIWMLTNFDCCALWTKNRKKFTEAFIIDPVYLQHEFSDCAVDYRHWGIPLSRRFRSLKLWFVIRIYGVDGLQKHIREHVRLAKLFESFVLSDDRFTLENDVAFGMVCFRHKGCNDMNMQLLSSINKEGKIFLVGTMLEEKFVIRFCVCSEKAKDSDIEHAWQAVTEATKAVEELHTKSGHDCKEA